MTERFEKMLDKVLNDPVLDCDMITIGDIDIFKWNNLSPKYQTSIAGDVVAEGDNLFEVLRKTFF